MVKKTAKDDEAEVVEDAPEEDPGVCDNDGNPAVWESDGIAANKIQLCAVCAPK